MSQNTKRDANEAFGDNATVPPSSTKRRRRSKGTQRDSGNLSTPTKSVLQRPPRREDSSPQKAKEKKTPPIDSDDKFDQDVPAAKNRPEKKVDRRGLKKSRGSKSQAEETADQVVPAKDERKPDKELKKKKKEKLHSKAREDRIMKELNDETPSWIEQGWEMSITGGYFLDQDPVLSKGDKELILPTKSNVHIFSAATSLLVRSLPITLTGIVTCCIICQSNSNHLLVSTRDGKISKWDWTTGRRLRQWKTRPELLQIYGIPADAQNKNEECIMLLNNATEGTVDLSHCDLNQPLDRVLKVDLLRSTSAAGFRMRVLEGGKKLVASAGDKLIICSSPTTLASPKPPVNDCTWREVAVPGRIASFDAKASQLGGSRPRMSVDVVLGLQDGAILVYEDVLFQLVGNDKGSKSSNITSRRLHWHRDAVSSVKWSRDGNYLISGGRETVLVIWQLDTNQKQYLPHLSAPICNLNVSESGASYAVRLADNSVMVLSTSDLLPTTNINGVSVGRGPIQSLLVDISPNEQDQLLLATATDLPAHAQTATESSTTMLQTFDMRLNHQVSRQALARNTTTVVNINPRGQRVIDPDVLHLKVSSDGMWLATVDEWTPPENDIQPLHPPHDSQKSKCDRTETCLRFWSRDERLKTWQMTTRIDQPHLPTTGAVLALAVNPVKAEFATAGKDGHLRIWTPKSRMRDGMPVKDSDSRPLFSWVCNHTLQPDSRSSVHPATSAALAYSEDGSAIAASWSLPRGMTRMIHFIDSHTGSLRASQPDLCSPGNTKLAFSGTHLLALSNFLCIWDVVNSRLTFSIVLNDDFVQGSGGFLAANPVGQTFAIALNPEKRNVPAAVAIFSTRTPGDVLYHGKVHRHVKALLPASKAQGYIIIDGEARIRHLRPSEPIKKTYSAGSGPRMNTVKGLNDIFGSLKVADGEKGTIVPRNSNLPRSTENDKMLEGPTRRGLDEVLEQQASSTALPVSVLFQQVASLFARRPIAV